MPSQMSLNLSIELGPIDPYPSPFYSSRRTQHTLKTPRGTRFRDPTNVHGARATPEDVDVVARVASLLPEGGAGEGRRRHDLHPKPWDHYGAATLGHFDIDLLERQVDELVRLCQRLREENASLRTRQEALMAERGELIEKNEQARSRVEAMLSRLRAMEESL